MKFTDLEPSFLKVETPTSYAMVSDIKEADGVLFLCPKCFEKNGGSRGTHSMICWQPHVPQTVFPIPGRWLFHGTGLEDLTLDNSKIKMSSSVLEQGGCDAHYFITAGQVKMC